MRIARVVAIGLISLFVLLRTAPSVAQEAKCTVFLPKAPVRVQILFDSTQGLTTNDVLARFPAALAVLPGAFYAEGESLCVAGLLIWNGRCLQAPSRKSKKFGRAAVGITREWRFAITTAEKAFGSRKSYLFAFECAPFLWIDGQRWENFGGHEPSFYRDDAGRVAIGTTKNGRIFWASGSGGIRAFRKALAADFARRAPDDQPRTVVLLDGGDSTLPSRILPIRVAIVPSGNEPVAKR